MRSKGGDIISLVYLSDRMEDENRLICIYLPPSETALPKMIIILIISFQVPTGSSNNDLCEVSLRLPFT